MTENIPLHKISYLTSGEAPGLPYEVLKWQLHLFIFHFLCQDLFLLRNLHFYKSPFDWVQVNVFWQKV